MRLRHHGMLAAATMLLCAAAGARADQIGVVTIINATYTATCVGGGTCNEVVKGTFEFDLTTDTPLGINLQLTGSLNASLDTYVGLGEGPCTGPGCLQNGFFYDSNFVSGNPIEFSPTLDTIPTSISLPIDPSDSTLFVPTGCGGDQSNCGQTGSFPTGDARLSSGTYTAEALSPEPSSVILFVIGVAMLGFLSRRNVARTAAEGFSK